MRIVLRADQSDNLKVYSFATQDDASAFMIDYINQANRNGGPAPHFYRVVPQDGDFLLKKLRIQPGSEVTEQIIGSATFEDDV